MSAKLRGPGVTLVAVLSSLLTFGCGGGGGDDTPPPDGGRDASSDAAVDTGTDTGTTDGGTDATPPPTDTGTDTAVDAGPMGCDFAPAADPACGDPTLPSLSAVDIVPGRTFDRPVFLTVAPGDCESLYVVEQPGVIRVVRDGAVLPTPFLDIRSRIGTLGAYSESGLLGLAFHPDYATNGRFFVYYTAMGSNANRVAELARSAGDPLVADTTEVRRLVDQDDRQSNHNGGMIAFGPDGYLYVGMGDEGGAGDMHGSIGNSLDRTNLFGSILRLDVDNEAGNFAAAGNPFSLPTGLPQIWAYGLRNPWRFSFDALSGDLYIGDVGQDCYEEIDVQPASSTGGENYGWRAYEGFETFNGAQAGLAADRVDPVVAERHSSACSGQAADVLRGACSIAGGYVYRGSVAGLSGVYFYGDWCSDDIGAFRYCGGEVRGHTRVSSLRAGGDGAASGLGGFGQDHEGNLYLVYVGSGHVRRITSP